MNDSCVYIHYLDDEVIYIGSGSLDRAISSHNRCDEHHLDMFKENFRCEIFQKNLSRDEAFRIEYKLGYKYRDLGLAKYFGHDMRGTNNPMYEKPLTNILNEEEIQRWKENLSKSMIGETNGYRTECIVIAPFEELGKREISFSTLIEAKKHIHENYGFSLPMIDKSMIDVPFTIKPKTRKMFRDYEGLMIRRTKFIGTRH